MFDYILLFILVFSINNAVFYGISKSAIYQGLKPKDGESAGNAMVIFGLIIIAFGLFATPLASLYLSECAILGGHYGFCEQIVHTEHIWTYLAVNVVVSGIVMSVSIQFVDRIKSSPHGAGFWIHVAFAGAAVLGLYLAALGAGIVSYSDYILGA